MHITIIKTSTNNHRTGGINLLKGFAGVAESGVFNSVKNLDWQKAVDDFFKINPKTWLQVVSGGMGLSAGYAQVLPFSFVFINVFAFVSFFVFIFDLPNTNNVKVHCSVQM